MDLIKMIVVIVYIAKHDAFHSCLLLKMRTISSEKRCKIVEFVGQGKSASEISRLLGKRIVLATSFANMFFQVSTEEQRLVTSDNMRKPATLKLQNHPDARQS